ncbi:hypothetical protein [Nitrosomonas aestuarii]|nr:hypothetical protein [Nitrosomonas aestuarii]
MYCHHVLAFEGQVDGEKPLNSQFSVVLSVIKETFSLPGFGNPDLSGI